MEGIQRRILIKFKITIYNIKINHNNESTYISDILYEQINKSPIIINYQIHTTENEDNIININDKFIKEQEFKYNTKLKYKYNLNLFNLNKLLRKRYELDNEIENYKSKLDSNLYSDN